MSQFCLNEKGEKKERKNDDKNKAASKYIIMCLCAYVQRTQAVTIHRHGPGFLNKNVRGRGKKKKKNNGMDSIFSQRESRTYYTHDHTTLNRERIVVTVTKFF